MLRISKFIIALLGITLTTSVFSQTQLHSGHPIYSQNGNIGIGAAPGNTLTLLVRDTATNTSLRFRTISNSTEGLLRLDNGVNWGLIMRSGANNPSLGTFGSGSINIRPFNSYNGDYDTSKGVLAKFDFNSMNVGIGTTSPLSKLHVQKSISNAILDDYTTTAIEDKDARLQLLSSDDGTNGSALILTNTNRHWSIHQKTSAQNNRLEIGYIEANSGNFPGNHTVSMSFANNGNIGIGTTSPKSALTIGHFTGDNIENTGLTFGTDHRNIEFIHSSWSAGYGSKIYNTDEGAGITSLRVATRGNTTQWTDAFYIEASDKNTNGNVGIGTNDPNHKLEVNGTIRSKKVRVEAVNWPDYVFDSSYKLISLKEVEDFIKVNKHLPDVPSAEEVEENGQDLGSIQAVLLKKMEEMTLYMIDMKKEIEKLKEENRALRKGLKD